MDKIVQAYQQTLDTINAMQGGGRFTLQEASAVFTNLVALKTGIEEALKNAPPKAMDAAGVSSAEHEKVQVELMSRNIELGQLEA